MQKIIGKDGREYIEINGTWYLSEGGRVSVTSRPKEYESCEVFTTDKEKEFFTKHLIKKKGES